MEEELKLFSELNARIDLSSNLVYSYEPFETFLGAPCKLLGRKEIKIGETFPSKKEVKATMFVHSFSPSDFKEGEKVEYTDLEIITHTKPTRDLADKAWSALAFNRSMNKIVSITSWSIWASDSGKKERWLSKLKNKYSNVPMIE